ncbi:MAG: hypothetical protein KatS3mg083_090 [Candidatus Dojkabacteria bacterium]|nr:MAG: hypothetical protein KatS3mg083_090 [Candidatus Dojkabacteria bacterium]
MQSSKPKYNHIDMVENVFAYYKSKYPSARRHVFADFVVDDVYYILYNPQEPETSEYRFNSLCNSIIVNKTARKVRLIKLKTRKAIKTALDIKPEMLYVVSECSR